MSLLLSVARWLVARLSILVVVGAVATRLVRSWRDRRLAGVARRQAERTELPSLYDRYPEASRAPRRRVGLRSIPLEEIVGTARHPTQNTADFLPLPRLRGENWRARWQRINRANDVLATLPPVELLQVGDEYYVVDGHNRVAAARQANAVEIDADVVQLLLPGVKPSGHATLDAGALIGADEVRQAASGRRSRTVEQRGFEDRVSREDLLRGPEES